MPYLFYQIQTEEVTGLSLPGPVTAPGGKKKKTILRKAFWLCPFSQLSFAVLWTTDQVWKRCLGFLLAVEVLHYGPTAVTLHQTIWQRHKSRNNWVLTACPELRDSGRVPPTLQEFSEECILHKQDLSFMWNYYYIIASKAIKQYFITMSYWSLGWNMLPNCILSVNCFKWLSPVFKSCPPLVKLQHRKEKGLYSMQCMFSFFIGHYVAQWLSWKVSTLGRWEKAFSNTWSMHDTKAFAVIPLSDASKTCLLTQW